LEKKVDLKEVLIHHNIFNLLSEKYIGLDITATQEQDKIIKLVQISTRNILSSYTERAQLLRECSEDVKLLIREGYDPQIAENTAERFFGTKENISFLAIDEQKAKMRHSR
jgi:ABC-type Na+ transport system ATPase subunit NatA